MPQYSLYGLLGGGGGGVTFPLLAPGGSALSPSYSFAGNTNTGIWSSGLDVLNFSTTGVERMQIDASGRLLIGTDSFGTFTATRLRVASNTNTLLDLSAFNNTSSGAGIYLTSARGTQTAPTATQSGDTIGLVGARGYGDTGFPTGSRASISMVASENWTDAAQGADLRLRTTATGSVTSGTRMTITPEGRILHGLNFTSPRTNYNNGATGPYVQQEGTDNTVSTMCLTMSSTTGQNGPSLYFGRTKGATIGSNDIVSNNDSLGFLQFFGADGTNLRLSSYIGALVDGTPSATSMPSRLVFATVPDGSTTSVIRQTITNGGQIILANALTTPRSNFYSSITPNVQIEGLSNGTSSISITDSQNANSNGWGLYLGKNRSGTRGGNGLVQTGDQVGIVVAQGNNGTNMVECARIQFNIEGTPSATSMGGRMTFYTTPDASITGVERMRITNAGNVGIGTASPGEKLEVSGNIKATSGDVSIATAGKGLKVAEGANAKMGTAVLVAGTVTVSTTAVTANSRIFLTAQVLGTVAAPKALAVTARVNGTSFTITSADNTDTSTVAWMMVEPA